MLLGQPVPVDLSYSESRSPAALRKKQRLALEQGHSGSATRLGALSAPASALANVEDEPHKGASFMPSSDAAHFALALRALNATQVIRNLSTRSENATLIARGRNLIGMLADVLSLSALDQEDDSWTELEMVREMKGAWLDICEAVGPKLPFYGRLKKSDVASSEAAVGRGSAVPPHPESAAVGGSGASTTGPSAIEISANTILARLIHFATHSEDRQVVLASLRSLGAIADNERNEPIFGDPAKVDAVAKRCAELLAVRGDATLTESALDCLYQLLKNNNNAIRLADGGVTQLRGHAPDSTDPQHHRERPRDVSGMIRLLIKQLTHKRAVWDRETPNSTRPDLFRKLYTDVPTRRAYEERQRMALSAQQQGRTQRWLNSKELDDMKSLPEPERLFTWLRAVYELKPGSEVSQMEVWTTYRDQFSPFLQHPNISALIPPADVIRQVSHVFSGASAIVHGGNVFVISGIDLKDRSYARRFECKWRQCTNRACASHDDLAVHVHCAHATPAARGRCGWLTCSYALPPDLEASSAVTLLRSHIKAHLPSAEPAFDLKEDRERWIAYQTIQPSKPLDRSSIVEQTDGGRRVGAELATLKRKLVLGRGTIDRPDAVPFVVTRTPMDATSGAPLGVAATAALVLRLLARASSTILTKSGVQRSEMASTTLTGLDASLAGAEENAERFGLPLPPATAAGNVSQSVRPSVEGSRTRIAAEGASSGRPATWEIKAAEHIMDALVDAEDELMSIASSNDILTGILNDILVTLQPVAVASLLSSADSDA
ncbi:hypothetical protein IE81DRAFT_325570 [Ceraceosorus guamensis]|uniref:RFX-type winged-helix domain-containing protein n=1 Tax=Ceraceosorus guamensis TaxID=1522189 RepID=A0A316VT55_9BASI|nr:hypothetical protein IE81DRAFT_325570 [Ceraceosorus guamensis]PWN40404.1 hypothetical protein IE81DRAFT_325570 [Ceraceosorus guamensis]